MFNRVVVLVCMSFIACAGCNENKIDRFDARYWKGRDSTRPIRLLEVRTDHVGNVATHALVGGAVGGAIGGVTLHALDGPLSNEMRYIRNLDVQALKLLSQELESNQTVSVDAHGTLLTGENWGKAAEADLKRTLAENPGERLHIKLRYTHKDSFYNTVAMRCEWRLYDAAGVERLKARTWVFSDKGSGLLPNTRNPKFEGQYLKLAQRSAAEFLALLRKKAVGG